MSIKKSLRILLILSSFIPVILVLVISHGLLTKKLIEIDTQSLQRDAENSISGLEAMIETQRTEVSLLSLQSELIEAVKLSRVSKEAGVDQALRLLKDRHHSFNNCVRIAVYDADGQLIISSSKNGVTVSDNSDLTLKYIKATKSVAVGIEGLKSARMDSKSIYTIDIGAPILDPDSNTLLGYVVSTMNTSYYYKFLRSLSIGKTGYGILLDRNGKIIYHPKVELIGTIISSEHLSQIVDNFNKGIIKQSGSFQYFYEGADQAYGYCVLPNLDWVLLVKQDISEIRSVTGFMLTLLTIFCLILFVVISVFAGWLSKKYSMPIIELRDAMRTASDGDLTVQTNIRSNNELGELSKNFNKMLHIIKTNYEDLESMHEELLSNEEQLRSNYDHIEFLAYHDTLTNLPNKLAFLDYVNSYLLPSASTARVHAVYFLDLDNFKTVNDTLGHEYGDALLLRTAELLTYVIGNNGMLARAGGDEFLLFTPDIASWESAVNFASRILETFKEPLDLNGEIVYISMSIGISIYPDNGLTTNSLIKNADIAMYKSKDTGKNKFTLFDAKMEEELNRSTVIIEVLRNAIDNNELYIKYQPLIELNSNNIIGFEALMRLQSERLGTVSPSEFIPIAEESGLITDLSSWLIREACLYNKRIIDLGIKPRPVSVNVSSIQINRPGFVPLLSEILEETQLPPQYLELELTESTLVSSVMDATKLLKNLQNLGVKISLDDFGTGYSSLNYLTKMPIDTLKIDKSFVENICNSKKDSKIAETIISLAHSLDIRVVAEGVEDEKQLVLLRSQHCDVIQGYIYYPPLNPNELLEAIRADDLITQCKLF